MNDWKTECHGHNVILKISEDDQVSMILNKLVFIELFWFIRLFN